MRYPSTRHAKAAQYSIAVAEEFVASNSAYPSKIGARHTDVMTNGVRFRDSQNTAANAVHKINESASMDDVYAAAKNSHGMRVLREAAG
jgi:hypothetical protein